MKKSSMLLIVVLSGVIASCGGGGGGGTSNEGGGISYVGLTAPVTFSSTNYSGVSNEFLNYSTPSDFVIGSPGILSVETVAQVDARAVAANIPSLVRSATRKAAPRASQTYPGNISGTITYSGIEPVLGSNYSFTVTFSNYADTDDTGGLVFNGVISVSGIESVVGSDYSFNENYSIGRGLSVTKTGVGGFTLDISGTASMNITGNNAVVLPDYVTYTMLDETYSYGDIVARIGTDYFRLHNYVVYTDWTNSGRMSMNGNIYYSGYGLVVVETISPVSVGSGTIHLHGISGTAVKLDFGWTTCTASLENGDDSPPLFNDGTVVLPL